jgi:hypothetical protein
MGKGGKPVPNIFESAVVPTILRPLQCLSAGVLARNTLRQILNRIFGDDRAEELVSWFPYRSEIDTLRADVALRSLVGGPMSSHTSYSVVAEGFSELVARMISDLPDNVVLLGRHEVIDVCPGPTGIGPRPTDLTVLYGGNKKMMLRAGEACIMAVHSEGLKHIGPFHTCAPLKQLKAEPLLRIYMIFPVGKGGVWFKGLGRVVFPDGLRYMIPIDETKGIVMISYTDGDDTAHYRKYIEKYGDESAELTRAVMRDVRRAGFKDVPDPTYTKAHYWSVGATYWLPGSEDVEELSRRLLHPYPQSLPGVYVCGESYSAGNQCWVEGALETAEAVVKMIG